VRYLLPSLFASSDASPAVMERAYELELATALRRHLRMVALRVTKEHGEEPGDAVWLTALRKFHLDPYCWLAGGGSLAFSSAFLSCDLPAVRHLTRVLRALCTGCLAPPQSAAKRSPLAHSEASSFDADGSTGLKILRGSHPTAAQADPRAKTLSCMSLHNVPLLHLLLGHASERLMLYGVRFLVWDDQFIPSIEDDTDAVAHSVAHTATAVRLSVPPRQWGAAELGIKVRTDWRGPTHPLNTPAGVRAVLEAYHSVWPIRRTGCGLFDVDVPPDREQGLTPLQLYASARRLPPPKPDDDVLYGFVPASDQLRENVTAAEVSRLLPLAPDDLRHTDVGDGEPMTTAYTYF
jgi:hypothetical protein